MTDEEKISMVKVLIGEDDSLTDELVKTYLNIAKGKMLKDCTLITPTKQNFRNSTQLTNVNWRCDCS